MFRFSYRRLFVAANTLALTLALVTVAHAQEGNTASVRDIHRLGGSTALSRVPLTTAATVKRLADTPTSVANVRNVLGQASLPGLTDAVVAALASANVSVRGGLCSDSTPSDGVIVECDVQPGQTLQWMAYRPTGGARLGLLRNIRWAGPRPFRAFLFRITEDSSIYTFVLPKECGNLSLMNIQNVPRAVAVVVPPAPEVRLVAGAVAPVPPPPFLPPPAPEPGPVSSIAVQAPPPASTSARVPRFFVDALFGKDRRVRPIAGRTTGNGSNARANSGNLGADFAQCSPLFGVKFGVAKRFHNDWEIAGAAGIAISLVHADDKVNESEIFADVEANKYLSGGAFIGTGLSLWDLSHSDTMTPAWMIHAGIPMGNHPVHQVYFVGEGRFFFDHLDDTSNNYQFWGGLRIRL